MKDIAEQATNELRKAQDAIAKLLASLTKPSEQIAGQLMLTEYNLGQAKADAWTHYQTAKAREERITLETVLAAARAGELEGRNAEERKRLEDGVKNTNVDILDAVMDTLYARNMNDCVSNAHASVLIALNLAMTIVTGDRDEDD